jgi:hypothetical protein
MNDNERFLTRAARLADMWYACHVIDDHFGRGSQQSADAWREYREAGGQGN